MNMIEKVDPDIAAMHEAAMEVARLWGDGWRYEGDPTSRVCDIVHQDGYGVGFFTNHEPRITIVGIWPRLIDEFNRGGYLFHSKKVQSIKVSCYRDRKAMAKDIKRRFLTPYLEVYAQRLADYENELARSAKKRAVIQALIDNVPGAKYDDTMWTEQVFLYPPGKPSWAKVRIESDGTATAEKMDLPEGVESVALEAVYLLFPSESPDPMVAKLEDDCNALLSAITILRECIPAETRSKLAQRSLEVLGDAWNELQDKLDDMHNRQLVRAITD